MVLGSLASSLIGLRDIDKVAERSSIPTLLPKRRNFRQSSVLFAVCDVFLCLLPLLLLRSLPPGKSRPLNFANRPRRPLPPGNPKCRNQIKGIQPLSGRTALRSSLLLDFVHSDARHSAVISGIQQTDTVM